jgi:hypothetical protein
MVHSVFFFDCTVIHFKNALSTAIPFCPEQAEASYRENIVAVATHAISPSEASFLSFM